MSMSTTVWATVVAVGVSSSVLTGGQSEELGTIHFPNSGSAAAQPHFLKGVKLLHSFEWEDAAGAFKTAQELDPASRKRAPFSPRRTTEHGRTRVRLR